MLVFRDQADNVRVRCPALHYRLRSLNVPLRQIPLCRSFHDIRECNNAVHIGQRGIHTVSEWQHRKRLFRDGFSS
jgi:hypothetical protein